MFPKSVLGQVEQPIIGAGWECGGGEEGLSFVMMGKEEVVWTDAVEAVSSSKLVRLDRIVRTRLCALGKCETIEVDRIKDWSKWVRGFIALCEPPKNSGGCEARQMEFALPNMLCGTLVLYIRK